MNLIDREEQIPSHPQASTKNLFPIDSAALVHPCPNSIRLRHPEVINLRPLKPGNPNLCTVVQIFTLILIQEWREGRLDYEITCLLLLLFFSFAGNEDWRLEARMVFYFKARPDVGDYTIFMGLDKRENEELIKYGFPEDIW